MQVITEPKSITLSGSKATSKPLNVTPKPLTPKPLKATSKPLNVIDLPVLEAGDDFVKVPNKFTPAREVIKNKINRVIRTIRHKIEFFIDDIIIKELHLYIGVPLGIIAVIGGIFYGTNRVNAKRVDTNLHNSLISQTLSPESDGGENVTQAEREYTEEAMLLYKDIVKNGKSDRKMCAGYIKHFTTPESEEGFKLTNNEKASIKYMADNEISLPR